MNILAESVNRVASHFDEKLLEGLSVVLTDHKGIYASIDRFEFPRLQVSSVTIEFISQFAEADGKKFSVFDALDWLVMHELQHLRLGHFELGFVFDVAQRAKTQSWKVANVIPEKAYRVSQCIEMQADHEAISYSLGSYLENSWSEMRKKIAAISAMMVLIEREDAVIKSAEKTHPKAATRIFQLLCHVAEMPLIKAHLENDPSVLPTANKIERFGKEVTLPCYFDALRLAEVGGAMSIQADLGAPQDFFADMELVKLGQPHRYSYLRTEGAKEWVTLWKCNEMLKTTMQAFT